ncbi:MAG TPA: ferredoxin [Streptosporangiaceae bacterium]
MKIHVDTDACSGSGNCTRIAPRMLTLVTSGDQDVAEVIPGGEATDDELIEAARSCPWFALTVEDDQGNALAI